MTTNTVTQTQGFQITTAAGAYIGAPYASLAAAGTALAGMAPGNYAIIPVTLAAVTAPPVAKALGISVKGNQFVDQNGNVKRIKMANCSGLEGYAIQNQAWMNKDPWGGRKPIWANIVAWGFNAVRIPLNEASWLGLTTYDYPVAPATVGASRLADPWGNYQATVIESVNEAVAAGLIVFLDDHINGANGTVPGVAGKVPMTCFSQNLAPSMDHSPAFWTSIANTFKNNPAVGFDLFNEPHIDGFVGVSTPAQAWAALLNGGTTTQMQVGTTANGGNETISQGYATAGIQTLLNAVRATGATNVCLAPGLSWCLDVSQWVAYAPVDPLKQLAASWHGYANASNNVVPAIATSFADVKAILTAGYPVLVGETGDYTAAGKATWLPVLLPFLDSVGASVGFWTWDAWSQSEFNLILDDAGTPTPGEGVIAKAWALAS
jgi:endoglucanase